MCIVDPVVRRRQTAEKKHVYKAIRDEQARQKEQQREKQQQQNQNNGNNINNNNNSASSSSSFPDMEKLRSAILCHTKGGRDRALARGNEYARAQQRTLGLGGRKSITSTSMKNLFLAGCRTQSAAVVGQK